jgi:hypothetical protein
MVFMLLTVTAWGQTPTGSEQVTWNFSGTMADDGTWEMMVTAPQRTYQPGDTMNVAIEYTIHSPGLAWNIDKTLGVYTLVTGQRVFDGNGDMIGSSHEMISPILTGVGLPIEGESRGFPTDRFGGRFHHPIDSFLTTPGSELDVDTDEGTITGTAVHGITMQPGINTGWYQLRIDIGLEISKSTLVTLWGEDPNAEATTEEKQTYSVSSPIAIGTSSQPRMIWTLFSGNAYGDCAVAVEDEGYVAMSRDTGYHSMTVLPMTTAEGTQARYLLEPDFPLVWNPFMRASGRQLELDFESGWMEVQIENPDGSIINIPGAAFSGRRGMGGTTLQDRFEYSFSSYGLHKIQLTGWIKDKSGQVYTGGGVYEIWIARRLNIETNVLNGTPFKKNEFFDPGLQIFPPMAANIDVSWDLDEHSSGVLDSGEFEFASNRWGYFSPPDTSSRDRINRTSRILFDDTGEYRVDFRAMAQDKMGTLWIGEKIIAGVVLSDKPTILSSRPQSGGYSITSDARMIPAPANSGDTMLIPSPSSPTLPTVFTFPLGFLFETESGFRTDDAALLEILGSTTGRFVTPIVATSDGLFPHIYPESIDRRAYLVSAATRPNSLTEAHIGDGSEYSGNAYSTFPWVTGELPIDSPGDYYHIWSSMVYRDVLNNTTSYGAYNAGVVVSGDVSSPVEHSAKTSLISDGWGSRSLFLHNSAVRPGSLLSAGSYFTPGAYFLPLPEKSTVEFTVTPPNGIPQIVTLQADSRGYISTMRDRIKLDKSGVWSVQTRLTQESQIGGILGVQEGQPWFFYVLDSANKLPIKFNFPPESKVDPADGMLSLTGNVLDADIATGTVNVSSTFDGAVIEQTQADIADSSFTYTLDLNQVTASYPNYSPEDPNDRIVMSFFCDGLSSTGKRRFAARVVYIQGGVLYASEWESVEIKPVTYKQRIKQATKPVKPAATIPPVAPEKEPSK